LPEGEAAAILPAIATSSSRRMTSAVHKLALAFLMLGIGAADGARALQWSTPLEVADVRPDLDLILADGRTVRLAGVGVPEPLEADAVALVAGLLEEKRTVRLGTEGETHDRYGRLVAQVEREDALWLQGALLERGLAWIQTQPGETARIDAMRALERKARAGRRGLWADSALAPQAAKEAQEFIGSFRIVRGRVLRVDPSGDYIYLNFGENWWEDFTVRLREADLRQRFEPAGIQVADLAGRRVEVRGVVLESGGPLIDLSHPEQIEVLP
jgi:micrococcal nuclease